ncbi:MAG: redoxin domain-containing protein [Acidobacteriota bacterium]
MAIEVGAQAPDFTLPNQDRTPVTLSELCRRGPVVLAFFPAAFSSVCERELCTFRDSLSRLEAEKGQVVGISTDTFFALKAWSGQQGFTFPLLSDYNKDVIRAYGVVNPDMIGLRDIAKRAVFVVDRHGVVRHRQALDDARLEPDYDAVRAALSGLSSRDGRRDV